MVLSKRGTRLASILIALGAHLHDYMVNLTYDYWYLKVYMKKPSHLGVESKFLP